MLFINKLFNSIACLLSFTNLQLVIPGRTWILLYLGRTVYKRLWACLALYKARGGHAPPLDTLDPLLLFCRFIIYQLYPSDAFRRLLCKTNAHFYVGQRGPV